MTASYEERGDRRRIKERKEDEAVIDMKAKSSKSEKLLPSQKNTLKQSPKKDPQMQSKCLPFSLGALQ